MNMTYNEKTFLPALNQQLAVKLDALITWQGHVLEYIIDYLVSASETPQLSNCESFLQLIAKIRFNLESVNFLLPQMYEDYRFKTSINVLYRTIVDDMINCYYLFGTVNLADPEQNSLGNELLILHKEFIQGSIKGIAADLEFSKFVNGLNGINNIKTGDIDADFKKANPELCNAKGDWKKNSEIRTSTHQFFKEKLGQGDTGFISEASKLKFLSARGVKTHTNMTALFKYFSQYQHFSPKAHDLLNSDIEQDIVFYQRALGELLVLAQQLMQFLEFKDKPKLAAEWEVLAPLVFNSFSNEE